VVDALARALRLDSDQRRHFRAWWAEYPIRSFRPATIAVDHPAAGVIELEMFQLRPVEHPDMLLVLQVPRDDEARRRLTALLDGPG
jgi:hypothetical protein